MPWNLYSQSWQISTEPLQKQVGISMVTFCAWPQFFFGLWGLCGGYGRPKRTACANLREGNYVEFPYTEGTPPSAQTARNAEGVLAAEDRFVVVRRIHKFLNFRGFPKAPMFFRWRCKALGTLRQCRAGGVYEAAKATQKLKVSWSSHFLVEDAMWPIWLKWIWNSKWIKMRDLPESGLCYVWAAAIVTNLLRDPVRWDRG